MSGLSPGDEAALRDNTFAALDYGHAPEDVRGYWADVLGTPQDSPAAWQVVDAALEAHRHRVLADSVNQATTAAIDGIRSNASIRADVYDRVNALAGEATVDALAQAAAAEARSVVLGLWHDLQDGTEQQTDETAAFFAAVDLDGVDWPAVGEALLLDVVTQTGDGE